MASTKSTKTETTEVKVKETEVTEKAPANKTAVSNNTEIEILRQQIAEMKAQNEMLMKMMTQNMGTPATPQNSLYSEVTIVHLVDLAPGLTTHIALTNLDIDMTAFGEERTLDRRQAEELAGKYRGLFARGVIAFGSGSSDIAKRFDLKTVDQYEYINSDFINKLATLDVAGLETLYGKLCDGHKAFIIEYFKRKIIENDPRFKEIHKVEMLDRVSGGAMQGAKLDMAK